MHVLSIQYLKHVREYAVCLFLSLLGSPVLYPLFWPDCQPHSGLVLLPFCIVWPTQESHFLMALSKSCTPITLPEGMTDVHLISLANHICLFQRRNIDYKQREFVILQWMGGGVKKSILGEPLTNLESKGDRDIKLHIFGKEINRTLHGL